MNGRKLAGMTRKATVCIVFGSVYSPLVRVVASAAPQLAVAVAGASARGQLFRMADDLEFRRRHAGGKRVPVSRKDLLQRLAWMKIRKLFAGVENADDTG